MDIAEIVIVAVVAAAAIGVNVLGYSTWRLQRKVLREERERWRREGGYRG